MADPTTSNQALAIPTHGSDVDSWDQPLNNNSIAIDGLFGGVSTISLSNANVTLSAPSGTITPSPGPTQAQNAILKLSGTLTANVKVTLPLPGFYIIDNQLSGNFVATLGAASAGNIIGVPPGVQTHVYNDGTDVKFVNMGFPSRLEFLAGYTAMPAWVTACTVKPYLYPDGTIYNISDFPVLGGILGSKFGGNGVSTFAVPDVRSRLLLPYGGGSGRVTTGGCGIDGTVLGAAGGSEFAQAHNHAFSGIADTITVNTLSNTIVFGGVQNSSTPGGGFTITILQSGSVIGGATSQGTYTPRGTNSAFSGGNSQNMPPAIVTGIWAVKT